jgi:transposase
MKNNSMTLAERNAKIKLLEKSGYSRAFISKTFELHPSTISQIVSGTHGYSEKSKVVRRKTQQPTKAKKSKPRTKKQQVTTYSVLWGLFTMTRIK